MARPHLRALPGLLLGLVVLCTLRCASPPPAAPTDAAPPLDAPPPPRDAAPDGDDVALADVATDAPPGEAAPGMDAPQPPGDTTPAPGDIAVSLDAGPRDGPEDTPRVVDADPATAPTVRITAPMAGATLTGSALIQYVHRAPEGLEAVEVLLDGRVVGRSRPLGVAAIDTLAGTDGPHVVGLRVHDAVGRSAMDTVSVTFRNAAIRLTALDLASDLVRNGGELAVDATFTGPALTLTADFAPLDTGFDPARVMVTDRGGGRYAVRYTVTPGNRRPEGRYVVSLVATERARPALRVVIPLELRLASAPAFPFELRDGIAQPTPPPTLRPVAMGEAPRVESLTGPGTIVRGGEVALDVRWTARAGVPVAALVVTVEGHSGHVVVPVSDGAATRATVTLRLPLTSTLPAGMVRVALRVVDAARNGTPEASHALRVEDRPRGGGGMVRVAGLVRFQKYFNRPPGCTTGPYVTARTLIPLRAGAEVEVFHPGLRIVVARGVLDGAGRYELAFPVPLSFPDRVVVRVHARRTGEAEVVDGAVLSDTHVATLDLRITGPTPHAGDMDITGAPAGAMNILANMVEARGTIRALALGRRLPLTRVVWQAGAGAGVLVGTSHYNPTFDQIRIDGRTPGEDEHDDSVLRHEFGHFVEEHFGLTSSFSGGPHATRMAPRRAWSEGLATFLGQYTLGSSCYADSPLVQDVAAVHPGLVDTEPAADDTGDVSEWLVASVAWRLNDPAYVPPAVVQYPTWWSLLEYLPQAGRMNHGGSGIDLVDFLHGWMCAERCAERDLRAVLGAWSFTLRFPGDYTYCPATVRASEPLRCAGRGALALLDTGVARVSLRDARVLREPVGGVASGVVPVGPRPRWMAVNGLLPTLAVVTNGGEDTVSVVDITAGREREVDTDANPMTTSPGAPAGITRLVVGAGPRGVATTSDGGWALVAVTDADRVAVLDLSTLRVCKTFAVTRAPSEAAGPAMPYGVAMRPDDAVAYVSLWGSITNGGRSLVVVDMARARDCARAGGEVTGHVTTFDVRARPAAMAYSPGRRLAVALFGLNNVRMFDRGAPSDGGVGVDLVPARTLRGAGAPSAVAWTHDGLLVAYGHLSGVAGTRLVGGGTVRLGRATDGFDYYDVGVRGSVSAVVVSPDDRWVYASDLLGNITALSVDLWDGSPSRISVDRDHTGGCLDPSTRRAVACLPALGLGAPIQALLPLP